ncbi:hypothetical protein BDV25DRAFT_10432 [Aspergillus avenaceus]|uniref:Calcium-dependent phosphotriesterase n=1 Tax=Aspergillus avenaceus TaxID=36643 RepID=A0A5N6TR95_ASPAV|nr:hypothetical protein BDV25DRAFT_10432 [Aspergillus avenaceus]
MLSWTSINIILPFAVFLGLYGQYIYNTQPGTNYTPRPLEDFPGYRCRRINHPLLGSCEDLWLDSVNRKLYAACSNPAARKAWSPGANTYDLPARKAAGGGTDHITVLDVDQPGADGLFGVHALNFQAKGHVQTLDLHGFDARQIDNGRLRFWLINHRPPLDPATGEELTDATQVGANSTIEVYDLDLGLAPKHLEHVTTIASHVIISPNNLVMVDEDGTGEGGFLFTNDHGAKVGEGRDPRMHFGDGSVGYCRTDTGKCHIAAADGCSLPNGITRDPSSGLVYVAQSAAASVTVYRLAYDNRLFRIGEIGTSIAIDNLSIDSEGNVFGGAIPVPEQFMKAFHDPYETDAPSTVLMIRNKNRPDGSGVLEQYEEARVVDVEAEVKEQFEVVRVVEDAEAKVLPTTTTVVHDPISGRLFLGGVSSPFMGVCERVERTYN